MGIKPRVATNTKLVVVYDSPQHASWIERGMITPDGITKLVVELKALGISFEEVSVLTLSDVKEPKAQDFKNKEAEIIEFIEVNAPSVLLIPTAKAYEVMTGNKGASKFYGKVIYCDKYKCKAVVSPPYSMLAYKPDMQTVITNSLKLVKQEMEYPQIIVKEKAEKKYVLIDTIEKFRSMYKFYVENVFSFSIDIETTSLQFNTGKVLSIQLSHKKDFGAFIQTPDYGGNWSTEEWDEIISGIKYLVEDDSREKIVANGYFDFKHLCHKYGIQLPKHNVFDVLIASFLTLEDRESHSLKFCAATLLDDAGDYDKPLEEFKTQLCKEKKLKKSELTYDMIPLEIMFPYGCMDVDYCFQLADYFKKQLIVEEQEEVFKDVSSYAWALARIEQNGWKVDVEEAARYKEELEGRIKSLNDKIQQLPEIKVAIKVLSGLKLDQINLQRKNKLKALPEPLTFLCSSPNHKRLLFKDILRFPEIKKTKKGFFAVDKECFAVWAERFPNVASIKLIKEVEELQKMLSTYVNAIINMNVNGRLHCSFRVCGAATGRISSTKPNLQNVVMHSAESVNLKRCFIAEEGYSLVIADLSNAELRVTAAISKDKVMCDGFINGLDPHSNTAKEVFNLPCEVHEVKHMYPEARQNGKTLGFSALYGAGASTVAKRAGISNEAAQEMLDTYFERHSGVARFFADNIKFAVENGYVVAVNGRRRRVPYITSEDRALSSRAARQANNFQIQSVSSDTLLQAVVNMLTEIDEKNLPYRIINVIHDSCEMEVPDSCVKEAHDFILRHMSIWPKGIDNAPFPMKADAEVGKNWNDVAKFDAEKYESLQYQETEDDEEEDQ